MDWMSDKERAQWKSDLIEMRAKALELEGTGVDLEKLRARAGRNPDFPNKYVYACGTYSRMDDWNGDWLRTFRDEAARLPGVGVDVHSDVLWVVFDEI